MDGTELDLGVANPIGAIMEIKPSELILRTNLGAIIAILDGAVAECEKESCEARFTGYFCVHEQITREYLPVLQAARRASREEEGNEETDTFGTINPSGSDCAICGRSVEGVHGETHVGHTDEESCTARCTIYHKECPEGEADEDEEDEDETDIEIEEMSTVPGQYVITATIGGERVRIDVGGPDAGADGYSLQSKSILGISNVSGAIQGSDRRRRADQIDSAIPLYLRAIIDEHVGKWRASQESDAVDDEKPERCAGCGGPREDDGRGDPCPALPLSSCPDCGTEEWVEEPVAYSPE